MSRSSPAAAAPMEQEEDLELRMAAAVPMEIGCCISLGVLLALGSPRHLSTAVELAYGAFKGAGAVRHLLSPSSPLSLLFASKAFAQGYKISKTLNLRRPQQLSTIYRRLRPYVGAVDLVRYAGSPVSDFGFLGLGLLGYGYKLSKNFLRVLEGLVGVELDAAARSALDNVGMMVKAATVANEVRRMAGGEEGTAPSSPSCRSSSLRGGVQLCAAVAGERPPVEGKSVVVVEKQRALLGALFCLSVPLDERLISRLSRPL